MALFQNKIIRVACCFLTLASILCACSKQPDATATTLPEETVGSVSITEPITEPTTQAATEPSTAVTETTTVPATTAAPTTQKPVTQPATTAVQTTEAETTVIPTEVTEATTLNALQATEKIIGYFFLTPDRILSTATDLADKSDIYYVRLQDGRNTFYIAVDLQTAEALSIANPQVLRELCRQLETKQQEMADSDKEYVLMDYRHLVGELEVHYVGYLLTGALGGESGPLASFYNSCKVADLNIDESRFGPIIDIIGVIYG